MTILSVDPSIQSGHLTIAVFDPSLHRNPFKCLLSVYIWKSKTRAVDDSNGVLRRGEAIMWFNEILKAYGVGNSTIVLTEDLVNKPTFRRHISPRSYQLLQSLNSELIGYARAYGVSQIVEIDTSQERVSKAERQLVVRSEIGGARWLANKHATDACYRGACWIKQHKLTGQK